MKNFYKELYGKNAKIPEESFDLWADRARAYLEYFCTAVPHGEGAKRCICEIAELLYSHDKRGGVISESNDGYSVKFADGDTKKKIYELAKLYLTADGVMYRGDVYGRTDR